MKKNQNKDKNIMELVPHKVLTTEKSDDGKTSLLIPKLKGILGRLLNKRFKEPFYRLNLDDRGKCVWDNCNGNNNVHEISELLVNKFPDDSDNQPERIAVFMKKLVSAGAIELK